MSLLNRRGMSILDGCAIGIAAMGMLLIAFYIIASSNKMLVSSDNGMLKTGLILFFIGIVALGFRVPVWIKERKKESDKINDVAKIINADKVYGNSYVNFIGTSSGIKYKVTYRNPQYRRGVCSPSKLFIYIYLNRSENLKLFIINKFNWSKQGILTVLMLRKMMTGILDIDDKCIVRANDKTKAINILTNDNKRKILVSLCEQGYEVELSRKCIYFGREGADYGTDIESEKSRIMYMIAQSGKIYQEFGN